MTYAEARIDGFAESEFRIGKVVSTSLSVYSRNFIPFSLIAGVVWLPLLAFDDRQSLITAFSNLWEFGASTEELLHECVAIGVTMFSMSLVMALILHAVFQQVRGRPGHLMESASAGLRRFPSLLGVVFLFILGTSLGMLLLIVPAIILMVIWYVAPPACIVEKTGPFRSLGRSRELTYGYRWKLFAMIVLVRVVSAIGRNVAALIAANLAGAWGEIAVMAIWRGIAGGFVTVLVAVTYYYLRVAKEGADAERLSSVFD